MLMQLNITHNIHFSVPTARKRLTEWNLRFGIPSRETLANQNSPALRFF